MRVNDMDKCYSGPHPPSNTLGLPSSNNSVVAGCSEKTVYCKESSAACSSWSSSPLSEILAPKERGNIIRLVDPGQILRIRVLILSHYRGQTAAFPVFFFFFKSLLELEVKFNFLILGKRNKKICWGGGGVTQESSWTSKNPQRSFNDLNVKEPETYWWNSPLDSHMVLPDSGGKIPAMKSATLFFF